MGRDGIGGAMEEARLRQAAVKKPRGTGAQKKVRRGRARLNAAADEALEVFSKEIVFSLLEKTIDGNVTSAKLLVALAEGQFDCEDEGTMRSLLSLAERLAAEPQCSDEIAGISPYHAGPLLRTLGGRRIFSLLYPPAHRHERNQIKNTDPGANQLARSQDVREHQP